MEIENSLSGSVEYTVQSLGFILKVPGKNSRKKPSWSQTGDLNSSSNALQANSQVGPFRRAHAMHQQFSMSESGLVLVARVKGTLLWSFTGANANVSFTHQGLSPIMFKRHFSEFLRTKSRLLGTILEIAAWTKPSHLFSSVAHILFTLLQSHQPPTASLQSSFSPHDICTLSISSWGASFQTSLLPSSSSCPDFVEGFLKLNLFGLSVHPMGSL